MHAHDVGVRTRWTSFFDGFVYDSSLPYQGLGWSRQIRATAHGSMCITGHLINHLAFSSTKLQSWWCWLRRSGVPELGGAVGQQKEGRWHGCEVGMWAFNTRSIHLHKSHYCATSLLYNQKAPSPHLPGPARLDLISLDLQNTDLWQPLLRNLFEDCTPNKP